MTTNAPNYHRHRFPPDIISHAVFLRVSEVEIEKRGKEKIWLWRLFPPQFLPIGPCLGRAKRSYFDHDSKKYRISSTCGNGLGNNPIDLGLDRRRIRRCARFDSCHEVVDILHLRLRWPECCGFPVHISQSAVLNVAETFAL
jgi:hypothetical protein